MMLAEDRVDPALDELPAAVELQAIQADRQSALGGTACLALLV